MSLTAPAWLALLALAPLIVVLHLRRRESVDVASVRLWRLVAEESEHSPRARRPPSSVALWLQLLALCSLTLAMADPRHAVAEGDAATLIVIDGGAAMTVRDTRDGPTRFRRAASAAAQLVHGAGVPVSVWWAGPDPRPIVLNAGDAASVQRALDAWHAADAAADWPRLAAALQPELDGVGRVIVFSADTTGAERALRAQMDAPPYDLEIVGVGAPFENIAVESASIAQGDRTGRWRIEAMVRADGATPAPGAAPQIVASFLPDGATAPLEFGRRDLTFSASGLARPQLTLDLPGPGLLTLGLDHDDAVPSDDSYHAWLDPDPIPRSIVVLTARPEGNPLVRALAALDGTEVRTTVGWPVSGDVDVLVVDRMPDPWLHGSGDVPHAPAVLWFASAPGVDAPDLLERMDPGVAGWRSEHQAVRTSAWGSFEVNVATRLPDLASGTTLVHGIGGPLVQAATRPYRREMTIALDPHDRGWSSSTAFVTFLADAVEWAAPSRREVSSCTVGVPCPVPLGIVAGGEALTVGNDTAWRWPDGPTTLPSGIAEAWVPDRAGRWSVAHPEASRWFPVNPSPSASLAIARAAVAEGDPLPLEAPVRPGASRTPQWLLILGAASVLVEGLLGGRGRERFWRRSSLGPGPLARRHRYALALHAVTVSLLVAAIVGAPWPRAVDDRRLILLTSAGPANTLLPQGVGDVPSAATVDVRITAADASVDLERALRVGLASVDEHDRVRVLLAPETGPTRGDHVQLLGALVHRGIPVDLLVPTGDPDPRDLLVERVWIDQIPRAGDTVMVQAGIVSSGVSGARLRLYRDGLLESDVTSDLPPGRSLVRAPITLAHAGEVTLTLEIEHPRDGLAGNARASTTVRVRQPPVVHVFGAEGVGAAFAEVLVLQGYEAVARPPRSLGSGTGDYLGVDAVVLLDTPASTFTSTQLDALERYVGDLGGGLLITGGERAFGPGGYYGTMLDRLSPLGSQVPRDAPEVAMLFVLDRSGSMQQPVGGATRLDIAKGATLGAIELLGERSHVAIVVFDEREHLLLPFTSSADLGAIEEALAPLEPGGGTSLYPGLVLAAEILDTVEAATKHVLVLTDGLSQPGDFAGAVAGMVALGATVSAIAIGTGADVERVREIARAGGGTPHVTTDFRALPSILAQEVLLASGDPVVREQVVPRTGEDATGLLDGLPAVYPMLASFVETTAKEEADVVLEDGEGRPIMAAWHYGSGRVISFGSEAIGPWAEAWTDVVSFPRWWGQWLRWASQPAVMAGLSVDTHVIGDELLLDVTALTPDGLPSRGLLLDGIVETWSGGAARRPGHEVAPGRYEIRLPLAVGESTVHIQPAPPSVGPSAGPMRIAHDYPAAWAGGGDLVEVAAFALATGGAVLDDAGEPWRFSSRTSLRLESAWRPWALLSLVVWLVFLILRYAPSWLGSLSTRALAERRRRPLATEG